MRRRRRRRRRRCPWRPSLPPPKPIRRPRWEGGWVCQSDVRPSVLPSVALSLSQFPHMTLASSNMCDGRGREEEGEGKERVRREGSISRCTYNSPSSPENEAALCSIARSFICRNPRGGISREAGSCLRLRPSSFFDKESAAAAIKRFSGSSLCRSAARPRTVVHS